MGIALEISRTFSRTFSVDAKAFLCYIVLVCNCPVQLEGTEQLAYTAVAQKPDAPTASWQQAIIKNRRRDYDLKGKEDGDHQ